MSKKVFKQPASLLYFTVLLFSLLLAGCQAPETKKHRDENDSGMPAKDTVKKDTVSQALALTAEKRTFKRTYNDLARFIAGMKHEEGSPLAKSENMPAWKQYSTQVNNSWQKLEKFHLQKISSWASSEIGKNKTACPVLFYPFSGPDFLHASYFFPGAEKYLLFALEPVGTLPLSDSICSGNDTLRGFLGTVNKSLYSILNFSFFQTKSMEVNLKDELDGVLPLLMLFTVRTGHRIIDLRKVEIDSTGVIAAYRRAKKSIPGVEIIFEKINPDTLHPAAQQALYYFSANLHDASLRKNMAFHEFIAREKALFATYLKSASYLMYKNYFSEIRTLILGHSNFIVQDDSGIPFRFFKPEEWDVSLYGQYKAPISLFANWYQDDLKAAYADTGKIKPLTFGIGYNWQSGQSSLLVAKKKLKSKV